MILDMYLGKGRGGDMKGTRARHDTFMILSPTFHSSGRLKQYAILVRVIGSVDVTIINHVVEVKNEAMNMILDSCSMTSLTSCEAQHRQHAGCLLCNPNKCPLHISIP